MTQYNKLKSRIKNGTEVNLNLSLSLIRNSSDENNFAHKLLLANRYVQKIRKALANGSLANIKFSRTHLF